MQLRSREHSILVKDWGGRVVRRCWILNFQYRGIPLIWIIVGQRPTALVVGAAGGCFDIFSLLICLFSLLCLSLSVRRSKKD